MNDKNITDYDPSLDLLNPNRHYMDKYPDWAQTAKIDHAKLDLLNPNKSYMDKYPDWAQDAKIDHAKVAKPSEISKLTKEDYIQRKFAETMSPKAAEFNPDIMAATLDESTYKRR